MLPEQYFARSFPVAIPAEVVNPVRVKILSLIFEAISHALHSLASRRLEQLLIVDRCAVEVHAKPFEPLRCARKVDFLLGIERNSDGSSSSPRRSPIMSVTSMKASSIDALRTAEEPVISLKID